MLGMRILGLALIGAFQRCAQNPGQVAHILGDQIIMLHEALDPAHPRPVGIAHQPADFGLDVEGQTILGPAGDIVQVAAHRPQEVLGLGEPPVFSRR